MSVRFIIGRAGTGKTHHCLQSLRAQLDADPVEGPQLIFLVPEQASMQMERAILEPPTLSGSECKDGSSIPRGGASHRAQVLSFQRLAHRVLSAAGAPPRQAISETARSMVLRLLASRRADQLRYYGRVVKAGAAGGRVGGFFDKLSTAITELMQEAIGPDALLSVTENPTSPEDKHGDPKTRPAAGMEPIRQAKLHDLAVLYRDYLDYLGTGRLDPSQYLELCRKHLARCTFLTGAIIWVDGFASLSGQETLILLELARACARLEITLLADPTLVRHADDPTDVSVQPLPATTRLFQKTLSTYLSLRDRFLQAGIALDEPLLLSSVDPPRFRRASSIALLERRWDEAAATGTAAALDTNAEAETPSPGVELTALPTRRIEVDYAVSRVCQWTAGSGSNLRYRDIAVIVRDLEPYHDLISQAFSARGIPFFIDRRRPIAHHPLVELLRGAVLMVRDDLSPESMRLVLKTDLLGLDRAEVDALENDLLAHGIAGREAWRQAWSWTHGSSLVERDAEEKPWETETIARINTAREGVMSACKEWLSFAASGGGATGSQWSGAITEFLDRIRADDTLQSWASEAEEDGDLDLAEEHRQVHRDVRAFLDDLSFAFSGHRLTVGELYDVMETGLSGLKLGLVPPTVDQVLVGSIARSRHPNLKAVVVMGLNDGVFPPAPAEDSMLNDDDRETLIKAGLCVQPGTRDRVFEESMLAYVALTRASESLVVTYALSDQDVAELRPSAYVETLKAACPSLKEQQVDDPIRTRDTWDLWTWRDLTQRLAMEFRRRPPLGGDDPSVRERWNGLYEAVRGSWSSDPVAGRVRAALTEPRPAKITPAKIDRLYAGPFRGSVSQLETYAACPFQHFARYTLRLERRKEAQLEPVDIGQVHHAVLEDFVGRCVQEGRRLAAYDEDQLLGRLRESCDRVAGRLADTGALSDARSAYMLRRSAGDLARIIQAQRKMTAVGTARPQATELAFGFDKEGGLPALALTTPKGRKVFLRGYIDRVDIVELADELLGVVIDYKRTRNKHLDLTRVHYGLSLQLVAYMLALASSGRSLAGRPIRPIGAFYVGLIPQYKVVNHPGEVSADDLEWHGAEKPRGLICADDYSALDPTGETGRSRYYSFFRKKDGAPGLIDKTDAADGKDFRAVMERTRRKLGELADGILDGDVRVRPYRLGTFSPCSWCAMPGVCGFEMGLSDVQFLPTLKRSEIFQQLTAGRA